MFYIFFVLLVVYEIVFIRYFHGEKCPSDWTLKVCTGICSVISALLPVLPVSQPVTSPAALKKLAVMYDFEVPK
jgi:hypothetical protein